jgi:hypothetical protein
MVSSLLMVLPLPVGAPSSTLSSVWYSVWKACRWVHNKARKNTVISSQRNPRSVSSIKLACI